MNDFRLPRLRPAEIGRVRTPAVDEAATEIVRRVQVEGELALRDYAHQFGDPEPREVSALEMETALATIPAALRAALERTHSRIARYAEAQRAAMRPFTYLSDGFVLGQELVPIESVGAYIPAGRYPLPSTALMTITPARVAGVETIVACTPRADSAILAACSIAGVDRLFLCGGAQAVAALAFGTTLVPRVDKIAGPGNAYVAAAKRLVSDVVGTDAQAGPSEVAVIASNDANPDAIARSLLAEAEHDVDARAYLLCDDLSLALATETAIRTRFTQLSTAAVARASLESSGVVVCDSLNACADVANELAIEHVELLGRRAEQMAPRLKHYGALFVGTPAAFGDYGAGPNHTLPTNATARFSSGLSVYDFVLVRPYVRALDPSGTMIGDAALLAATEGLPAHQAALTGT